MVQKVTVIGLGFVGLSLASFLGSKNVQITGIDSDKKKLDIIKQGHSPFYEPKIDNYLKKALKSSLILESKISERILSNDFIFITVGTPAKKNGTINLDNLKIVMENLSEKIKNGSKKPCIIIKSTTVPGTAFNIVKSFLKINSLIESKHYDLLTNPEFLKEGSAMNDTIYPHLIVIGGSNKKSINKLLKFYKSIYPKNQKFLETNNTTAELIKYSNNAFLAMKISFINSIANICQKTNDVNVDDVAKAIGMDPRIGDLFLKAGPGYGGSCFPKDLQALTNYATQIGYDPVLFNAVTNVNDSQLGLIMNILKNNLKSISKKKICILGLSFKENTDDIRESVSIKLIHNLLKLNSIVTVHDPKAIENTKKLFGQKLSYALTVNDAILNMDCIILMTPWNEYVKLKENIFLKMKSPFIIDTRRALKISNKKIKYVGLGLGN